MAKLKKAGQQDHSNHWPCQRKLARWLQWDWRRQKKCTFSYNKWLPWNTHQNNYVKNTTKLKFSVSSAFLTHSSCTIEQCTYAHVHRTNKRSVLYLSGASYTTSDASHSYMKRICRSPFQKLYSYYTELLRITIKYWTQFFHSRMSDRWTCKKSYYFSQKTTLMKN